MSTNNCQTVKYIYNLPYFARKDLCRLLDQMEMWEELAGTYMEFDVMTIQDLRREERRGASPTDELLTLWGHKNHTVLELFALLSRMQHYQAMLILRPFVPPDYHRLIEYGEERLPLLSELKGGGPGNNGGAAGAALSSDEKHMDVGTHNFNNSETNNLLQSKMTALRIQQPEVKILNTAGMPTENKENMNPRCNGAVSPVRDNVLRLSPKNRDVNQQRKMSNASDISSIAENCGSVPHIDFQELVTATSNWSKENILGRGGFGTVYKGDWKNTQVAVKRIEQKGAESAESLQVQLKLSLRELQVLNSFRHDNILPLYGFSFNGDERCFIYQFMCNGSLEDRLLCRKGTEPLTWRQRHEIAKGTARGLQFLHKSTRPFIHGDIKSANILLDVNFIPRIGDFGLAREGPQDNLTHMKVSRVYGTRPYLPDEFLRGKQMSTKLDTFSFGIVLFELGTGLRAYDDARHYKLLREHVENCDLDNLETMIDSKIPKDTAIFYHVMLLGKKCISKLHRNRPEMELVLKELEQPPQSYSPRGPNSIPHAVQYSIPIPVYPPIQRQMSNTPVMQASSATNRTPVLPSFSPSPSPLPFLVVPSYSPCPSPAVGMPSHTPPVGIIPSYSPSAVVGVPSHSPSPSPLPLVLEQTESATEDPPRIYNGYQPHSPLPEESQKDEQPINGESSASSTGAAAAEVTGNKVNDQNGVPDPDIRHILPALSILGVKESKSQNTKGEALSTAETKELGF